MPDTEPNHLYIVDGYGFVFRAYHVMPPLTNPEGTPVGAVYGFTNMILKLRRQIRGNGASALMIVLDSGEKTFRNEMYEEYKANRPPPPEDLVPQFPLIREAAEALSIPTVEIPGYEADDIIATYVRQAKEQGIRVTIVSSDKDLMQLVDDTVHMLDAMKNKEIGIKEVEEKFGVPPEKVLDMLALMGDSVDNIPGVPGIGPKTAATLLQEYGDLETLLARAGEIKQNKRREALIEHSEQAKISKELATLHYDAPVDHELSHFTLRPDDPDMLVPFLQAHGFKSLAAKIEGLSKDDLEMLNREPANESRPVSAPSAGALRVSTLRELSSLPAWVNRALENGYAALQPLHTKKGVLTGLALATLNKNTRDVEAIWVPLTAGDGQDDLFGSDTEDATEGFTLKQLRDGLEDFLKHPSILKISADVKALISLLAPLPTSPRKQGEELSGTPRKQGEELKNTSPPFTGISPASPPFTGGIEGGQTLTPYDDLTVMAYCLDGTKHARDLHSLLKEHCGNSYDLETLAESPDEKTLGALMQDILILQEQLWQRLFDEKMMTLYETIERPLSRVLSDMEQRGIRLDPAVLRQLSEQFGSEMEQLDQEACELAGREFNLGSPKQLGEILFEEMGIEGGKKTGKSGQYKTGSDVLEKLAAEGHTIAEKILGWRMLSKLKSTYTDALAKLMDATTHRVHTTFNMTATTTGRLSSTEPNLQNIPIRTEAGRKIRTAFIAAEGKKLIGADYSQIELRLLAHIADIGTLKAAFREGQDIHALTASQVFGIPLEEMDATNRRAAKAINFGIIYGQSAFGLAASLGISRKQAADYIDAYFEQYPGIRKYMEATKALAHEQGYVSTLFGRKCFTPGITTKGPQRAFAERAAINAPLQGSAADIIKKAMIDIDRALKAKQLPAAMLLQVHDELILEVDQDAAEETAKLVKTTMQNAVQLSIPLTADTAIGTHWGEIH